MATVKENELQRAATQADPGLSAPGPVPEGDVEAFRRGMSRSRGLAEGMRRRLGAWILKASSPLSFQRSVPSCETATMCGPTSPGTRA